MPDPPSPTYAFGQFRLDSRRRSLTRNDERLPLTAKSFDTLLAFVERPGAVLEKDWLLARIWPGTVVEEKNLAVQIAALRRVLGDSPQDPTFIATLPGRGYQFVGDVRIVTETIVEAPHVPSSTASPDQEAVPAVSTPRGPWRRTLVISAPLLVALLVVGLLWNARKRNAIEFETIRSLAVLPFHDLSGPSRDDVLELGLADLLITRLSTISSLAIRPTSAVRSFTALDQDSVAAGRSLRVDAVVDGHVQRRGDRVRVTARLVDVRSGRVVWADAFDATSGDVFSAEGELTGRVAAQVGAVVTGQRANPQATLGTTNAVALQAYLKGRHFWSRWTDEGLTKAVTYFEEAQAADPAFARAAAGLADAYAQLGYLARLPAADAFPKAKVAVGRALALSPTLADAHLVHAKVLLFYDWKFDEAKREIETAMSFDPNAWDGPAMYGTYLTAVGDLDGALVARMRALDLDPTSPLATTAVGWSRFYQRRYREAVEWYIKALELDPQFALAQDDLGQALYLDGQIDRAIDAWLRARALGGVPADVIQAGRQAYQTGGLPGFWRHELGRALTPRTDGTLNSWRLARIHYELKDDAAALTWLERAVEERRSLAIFLEVSPLFDRLHGQPRFAALLARVRGR